MIYFKYLGRLLNATDYDWTTVIANLQKAQKSWSHFSSILGREGGDTKISGCFYLEVVQAILIFGS